MPGVNVVLHEILRYPDWLISLIVQVLRIRNPCDVITQSKAGVCAVGRRGAQRNLQATWLLSRAWWWTLLAVCREVTMSSLWQESTTLVKDRASEQNSNRSEQQPPAYAINPAVNEQLEWKNPRIEMKLNSRGTVNLIHDRWKIFPMLQPCWGRFDKRPGHEEKARIISLYPTRLWRYFVTDCRPWVWLIWRLTQFSFPQ